MKIPLQASPEFSTKFAIFTDSALSSLLFPFFSPFCPAFLVRSVGRGEGIGQEEERSSIDLR